MKKNAAVFCVLGWCIKKKGRRPNEAHGTTSIATAPGLVSYFYCLYSFEMQVRVSNLVCRILRATFEGSRLQRDPPPPLIQPDPSTFVERRAQKNRFVATKPDLGRHLKGLLNAATHGSVYCTII